MDAIEGKVVNRGDEDEDEILDIDVWLHEVAEEEEGKPFTFVMGGTLYTTLSPEDFDWQDQSRAASDPNGGDMRPFVRMLLSEEQYELFCQKRLPGRALAKIVEDWQSHHGITVPESRASRRASERTAKKPRPTSRRRTK
ncbi:hypothetical protein [Embleya sp. NPDC005971]|uniref:hypothetical protein n=1 Tax=Embleya sp. NPDC005971 TaxID=3156724 RepID=UPI0033E3F272